MNAKRIYELLSSKVLICVLVVVSLVVKLLLLPVSTGDYIHFLEPWVEFIKEHGYFAALEYDFYNYTPTYIYILVLIAKTGLNPVFCIKAVSILFEYLAAYFIGRIAYMKWQDRRVVWMALAIVPLLPSVVLNSAYLSQCDAIYAAFAIGSIYYALKDRPWLAVLFLGASFALKMQAVMVLPFFFVMMLKGRVKWYAFFLIPVVCFLSVVPAWVAGRPLADLLTVYLEQADHYRELTMNFPNLYIWISNDHYDWVTPIGIGVTCVLTLLAGFVLGRKRYSFSFDTWGRLAFAGAVIVPFFLPGMHERYMYLGDVLGVLYFLVVRRRIYLPVGVAAISAYSYVRCSRFNEVLPMEPAFFLYVFIIVWVVVDLVQSLKTDKETALCEHALSE